MYCLLQSFVVTQEDIVPATQLSTRPGMGRVVVATKDFQTVGQVVLRERPVLVWSSSSARDHFLNYLDTFLAATLEVKSLVLDMHTPDDDSDYMQAIRASASSLCLQYPRFGSLGVDKVTKLIGVANINSHEYTGKPAEAFQEVFMFGDRVHSGKSALFAYGSKIAHSCCPNMMYTSKTSDGCLQYKVVAPIKEGEIISFPYIGVSPSKPTHIRRQELLETKVFFCQCEICVGFDYARTHQCHTKGCSGRVSCIQVEQADIPTWSCLQCGPVGEQVTQEELIRKERDIEKKLDVTAMKMMLPGGVCNVHPSQAQELITEAKASLSPVHFLTLKCMAEASRICASHAASVIQAVHMGILTPKSATPFGSLNDLRLKSASIGLDYLRGCECVADKCFQGLGCVDASGACKHPPVYACTTNAFHAFQDLKELPKALWPVGSVQLLGRYVPMCYMQWGPDDADTQEMEASLMNAAVTASLPSNHGNIPRTFKSDSGRRASNKKKGKKGRKKK